MSNSSNFTSCFSFLTASECSMRTCKGDDLSAFVERHCRRVSMLVVSEGLISGGLAAISEMELGDSKFTSDSNFAELV